MIQQHLKNTQKQQDYPPFFPAKRPLSLSLDEKVPKVSSGDTSLHSVMVSRP